MAKSDFCFTYYDGDATRDMSHMNRLERGAYTDLIISQRKFGHMTIDRIKKTLGKDFNEVWESISVVLKQDQEQKYYIEWLETSERKAKSHAKKQSENRKGKTKHEPTDNQKEPKHNQIKPLEDGDGYEDDNELKNKNEFENFEPEFSDYERWTEDASTGNDHLFTNMLRKLKEQPNSHLPDLARSHLALLAKYPRQKPPDQHRFRVSLIDHIAKELKNGNIKHHKNNPSGTSTKIFAGTGYEEHL